MKIELSQSIIDELGFDLPDAIDAFRQDLLDHAKSEGVAAPVAHPLVEHIVRGGLDFEVVPDPPVPELPPLPIPVISDVQFARGLRKRGILSFDEARSFLKTGDVPAKLQALIDGLPEDVREDAELMICGGTVYDRKHPVTEQLIAAFGWTAEEGDAAWREFALL